MSKKSSCKKVVFKTLEEANSKIEETKIRVGIKYQELRSYKCPICKYWHHTSNLTQIYKSKNEKLISHIINLEKEINRLEVDFHRIKKILKKNKNLFNI